MHKKGFTLIELLVVIAIIAILAAILFPVFAKARDKARQSACQSHIKQLGIAVLMYAQDYDDTFPPYGYFKSMTTEQWGYRWDALIHVYVKNQKIYQCPSHTRDTSVSSYGINLNLGWRNYPTSSPIPIQVLTLADTKSPASLVLLYDSETEGWARAIGNGNGHYYFYYKPSNYFSGGRKHSGGDNICFVDGHVKWYRTNDLSTASGDLIITWNGISFEPSL